MTGFGEGKKMDYPFSLTDYVNEVKETLKENNIKKPSVIAHSFGARIAVKIASENENFFDRIVITGGAGLKPKTNLKKALKKGCFKVFKRFIDKKKLAFLYSSDYKNLSDVMKESFVKIVNENLDERLKSVKNKTLIIFGENDKETPVYMAKRFFKNIKDSELYLMKNAGHFCFTDNPYEFNFTVKEFLLKRRV